MCKGEGEKGRKTYVHATYFLHHISKLSKKLLHRMVLP